MNSADAFFSLLDSADKLWIGIENPNESQCGDEECDAHLLFLDGTAFSFAATGLDQSRLNPTPNDCLFLYKGNEMKEYGCEDPFPYVCQLDC